MIFLGTARSWFWTTGFSTIDREQETPAMDTKSLQAFFFTFPHIGILFSPSFVQNVLYHFFYLHSHIHEIPVKNAFPFLPRLERVELW